MADPVTPPKRRAPKAAAPAPVAAAPPPVAAPDGNWVKVGVGVGSAALVAALLYATRSKRKDWSK